MEVIAAYPVQTMTTTADISEVCSVIPATLVKGNLGQQLFGMEWAKRITSTGSLKWQPTSIQGHELRFHLIYTQLIKPMTRNA